MKRLFLLIVGLFLHLSSYSAEATELKAEFIAEESQCVSQINQIKRKLNLFLSEHHVDLELFSVNWSWSAGYWIPGNEYTGDYYVDPSCFVIFSSKDVQFTFEERSSEKFKGKDRNEKCESFARSIESQNHVFFAVQRFAGLFNPYCKVESYQLTKNPSL